MSNTAAVIPQNSTPILRNRSINLTQDSATSPSSTTMSESCVNTSFPHTEDLVAVRTHASAGFLATRKITIRSDPALLTCFDAADKQLYELWVPKT